MRGYRHGAEGRRVSRHKIGRAHAALEGAGILLRQAAALFLDLPAADRAAERERLAQAPGEPTHGEGEAARGCEDASRSMVPKAARDRLYVPTP
ncbi:hypothetical protein CP973_21120 [Streptomyces albofaciens JCM 4342]|uniref:hypothetical protein n=1 Tax=Streptomyces albofaciens TaxID=66866 RepID=UPI00123C687D|nr:hypothetical protein [Streptomyces albofaciens]KAA6212006.1 hypothetical protein CP973_21120 [Streptomyces albofaciens JCM 4342]